MRRVNAPSWGEYRLKAFEGSLFFQPPMEFLFFLSEVCKWFRNMRVWYGDTRSRR
jgi:hypothetical protein